MIFYTASFFEGRKPLLYLLLVLVLSGVFPTRSTAQELSLKLVGFFNSTTSTALVDRVTDFNTVTGNTGLAGGELAFSVSDKWSPYIAISSSNTRVRGDAGPLQWPVELTSGVYIDDDTWPNYRYVQEDGTSLVVSLCGRRYFDLGKKSILPFVSLQGDLLFNHSMRYHSEYSNRTFDINRPDFQPQFARVSEEIDKQKNISTAIVALVGVELRIGKLLRLRGGWAVRADLLDYARNVDYLRTFARGITLQAGINLPSARRTFFPKKDKEVGE
jgi:hypothetical protein